MAKTASRLRKTLSQANLSLLGADRLAELIMDAASSDPTLKRSLRLELAAELGASDLAQALDKRMEELAGSRARISWRKRPELIREVLRLRWSEQRVDRAGRLAVVEGATQVAQEVPSGPGRPVSAFAQTFRIALDDQLLAATRLGLAGLVDEVQEGLRSVGVGHRQKVRQACGDNYRQPSRRKRV